MADRSAVLREFMAVAGSAEADATHFLDAHGWNLEAATDSWFSGQHALQPVPQQQAPPKKVVDHGKTLAEVQEVFAKARSDFASLAIQTQQFKSQVPHDETEAKKIEREWKIIEEILMQQMLKTDSVQGPEWRDRRKQTIIDIQGLQSKVDEQLNAFKR